MMVVPLFDADKLCEAGCRFHTRMKLDHAIRAYSQALQKDPDNLQALMGRAYAYHEQFRNQEAIEDVSRAILLDPDDAHLYTLRGEFSMWIGKHQAAVDDFEKALELNPDDGRSLYLLGRAMEGGRQYDKAMACYHQALACGTAREREVHLGLGLCNLLQGRYDQVEQHMLQSRASQRVVGLPTVELSTSSQPLRILISTGQPEYDEQLANEIRAAFKEVQEIEFIFSCQVAEIITKLAEQRFDLFCCLFNNLIFAPDNDPWEKLHLLRYIKQRHGLPIVCFYYYPATENYMFDLLRAGADFAFAEPVKFKEEVIPVLMHFLVKKYPALQARAAKPAGGEQEWRLVAAGKGPAGVSELAQLIARESGNGYLYFCRGHALLRQARSQAAEQNTSGRIKKIDDLVHTAGLYEQAVADFQRALELDGEHGELICEAILAARKGKYELAAH